MQFLRADTEVKVRIGPFVDVGDGFTPETGVALGAADEAELLKHGSDTVVDISGATWAAVANCDGWYVLTITAGYTDTEGHLDVMVQDDSVCLPVHKEFMVMAAAVWDSLFLGTDKLEVDATLIEGGDATDAINAACDAAFATYDGPTKAELDSGLAGLNDLSAAQVNAEADTALSDYDAPTKAELDSGLAGLNDLSAAQVNAEADTALSDYDAPTKAELDSGLAGLNNVSTAEVNTEVDAAIVTYHLDHLFAVTYDPASKPGAADALLNELVESDGGVSRFTANTLEEAPSAGTNPNVLVSTTIASVTDQTHFTLTAGSDDDDAYNDQAIALYDASNNDYPSIRTVSSYVGATKTVTIDSAPDFTIANGDGVKVFVTAPGTTAPTVDQVADQVWNESQADHETVGSVGRSLRDAQRGGRSIRRS